MTTTEHEFGSSFERIGKEKLCQIGATLYARLIRDDRLLRAFLASSGKSHLPPEGEKAPPRRDAGGVRSGTPKVPWKAAWGWGKPDPRDLPERRPRPLVPIGVEEKVNGGKDGQEA